MDFNHLYADLDWRRDARVHEYQHQHRADLVEGPIRTPKFRAQRWSFKVRTQHPHRITMHNFDSQENKKKTLSELEFFFRTALHQVLNDGAKPTDIVHIYLNCNGIDQCFVFNPAGQYAVTLAQLMNPNGLHLVLETFANIIQSGKNVSLNDQTVLTICTFSLWKVV